MRTLVLTAIVLMTSNICFGVEMPIGNIAAMIQSAKISQECAIRQTALSESAVQFAIDTQGRTFELVLPKTGIPSWSESVELVSGLSYWRFSAADPQGLGTSNGDKIVRINWAVRESTLTSETLDLVVVANESEVAFSCGAAVP